MSFPVLGLVHQVSKGFDLPISAHEGDPARHRSGRGSRIGRLAGPVLETHEQLGREHRGLLGAGRDGVCGDDDALHGVRERSDRLLDVLQTNRSDGDRYQRGVTTDVVIGTAFRARMRVLEAVASCPQFSGSR